MAIWSETSLDRFGPSLRIDAEYYNPENLERESILRSHSLTRLGSIALVTDGIHASPEFDEGSGIRYISAKCVRNAYFELAGAQEIGASFHKKNPRTALRSNDIIIGTVGTIGFCAVVSDDMLPANCDRHVGIVRLFDPTKYDPHYIAAFINTKYGRLQTVREATGNVQLNLFIYSIAKIAVPFFGSQREIGDIVRKSVSLRRKAIRGYDAASQMLALKLGVSTHDEKDELGFQTSLDDITAAQRWDAEHFLPKYQRLLRAVLKSTNLRVRRFLPTAKVIGGLTNGHTPLHHDLTVGDVPFLTAEHVGDFRIDFGSEKRILSVHHRTELARTALKNADILMTIKGRIGNCAVVEDAPPDSNINQDVALINLFPGTDPFFFCAWFNSHMGRAIVTQFSTGGINPFLGLGNIRKLPFPDIDPKTAEVIGSKIRAIVGQARADELESHVLIKRAESMIEEMIEKSP